MDKLLPLEELNAKVPGVTHAILRTCDLDRIVREQSDEISNIVFSSADRLNFKGRASFDTRSFRNCEDASDLLRAYKRETKSPLIREIIHLSSDKNGFEVAEILEASIFPGVLHLGDVMFQDQTQPVPVDQQDGFRSHKGLGLLSVVIERAKTYARDHNLTHMTLVAASRSIAKVFGRHGFTTYDSAAGRLAAMNGFSVPMELAVG